MMARILPLTFLLSVAWAAQEHIALTPEALEDHFKIYLLRPDKRSAEDKTVLSGNAKSGYTAVISYWRSLTSRESADELCNAYKWLLVGRGAYGKGATEAFQSFPALTKITLRFFDIESGTKLGEKKAEIVPTQRVIPYLRIGVDRNSLLAKKADWAKVREEMEKGKCAEVGNRYLDEKWFDKDFIAKGR